MGLLSGLPPKRPKYFKEVSGWKVKSMTGYEKYPRAAWSNMLIMFEVNLKTHGTQSMGFESFIS